MSEFRPTPAQELWLSAPADHDVYVLASRACGKTVYSAFLFLQTALRIGGSARMLYLRKSQPAGVSFVDTCREVFAGQTTWNGNTRQFTFRSGATLTVAELADDRSLDKWLGQSFDLVVVDQLEQFPSPKLPDRIRGSIRGKESRFVGLGHPGGPGTVWIRQRLVVNSEEGIPALDEATDRPFIRFAALPTDNPHLSDGDVSQLRASVAHDPILARAHLESDWTALGDNFMTFDPDKVRFAAWPDLASSSWWSEGDAARRRVAPETTWDGTQWVTRPAPHRYTRRTFVAIDRGTRRPMVGYLVWVSDGEPAPDGKVYPVGSFCFFDEVSTHLAEDLTLGDQSSIGEYCRLLISTCDRYGIPAKGVVDPETTAYHGHSGGSLLDEFKAHGVQVKPAPRHRRVEGWAKLKGLLSTAGATDERGAYFSEKCTYWWSTSMIVPCDRFNLEEADPKSHLDHGLDAARYAVMSPNAGGPNVQTFRADFW